MSSYISLADAQTFFDDELETTYWDRASNATRTKALETATKMMDSLNFKDIYIFTDKTDVTIPDDFKIANALIAQALLQGIDPEEEIDKLKLEGENIQGVNKSYKETIQEHTIEGIVSARAWRLLKPYLKDGKSISFERIS